jgi:hypothetical protein
MLENGYARTYHVVGIAESANKIKECNNSHAAIEIFTRFALLRLKINAKYSISAIKCLNIIFIKIHCYIMFASTPSYFKWSSFLRF